MDPINPIGPAPANIPPVPAATYLGRIDRDKRRERAAQEDRDARQERRGRAEPGRDEPDDEDEDADEPHAGLAGPHIDLRA